MRFIVSTIGTSMNERKNHTSLTEKSFIVSTIGTSILTNNIDGNNQDEANWRRILGISANNKKKELQEEHKTVIDTLEERARKKLAQDDVEIRRQASAELNGIYGIYEGTLPENTSDQHYLICTDTYQGRTTGDLIKDFLSEQGFDVAIEMPKQLSTKDTNSFTNGTKELIKWLEDNVPWRRDNGYQVIFNLVGGFKSLQGYMQTFGTFYADETVYIFEGSSDLIKIPRLPIQIDTAVIENHLIKFALMDAGKLYSTEEIEGIPETLLEFVQENGMTFAGLSAWGGLIWQRTKSDLLSGELLQFPNLGYRRSFIDNYKVLNPQQRTDLQETLAQIATALEETSGDTTRLNERVSGLNFQPLAGFDNIYTFRIARGIRVSCSIADDGLYLYRYGPRNTINRNPN
ncbi:MAG: putative CRISPR-associated protein [Gammaproteobacteria bacterium]|nr:putative CRISPR-associated protein [Gammaproteobacteria bacterium]